MLKQSSGIFSKFGAENPPLRQAAKRYAKGANAFGKFKNLTQQMINFIFVELWKKYTNDYLIKNEL